MPLCARRRGINTCMETIRKITDNSYELSHEAYIALLKLLDDEERHELMDSVGAFDGWIVYTTQFVTDSRLLQLKLLIDQS